MSKCQTSATVVTVPQLAWWGDIEAELSFPAHWKVTACSMRGWNAPKLDCEGFEKAFANPIGVRPIKELARGKKNVVILFDDMSRPTKTAEIVPYVLRELADARVDEGNIQFICALGTHGAMTAYEFAKKLGEDVIARFNVYNHNPYENCVYLGKTSRGTPVSINAEFMQADLKIGIGAVLPHQSAGFGGGAKIILPGVASIETIDYNHGPVRRKARDTGIDSNSGMGRCEHNAQLLDIQEACRMSGLDVKIDAIVNLKRETTALFVGEPIAEYDEAVKLAREHYHTPMPESPDIVVGNCNAKVNETLIGKIVCEALLPEHGGMVVMVTNNPWGEVCHYLRRRFGNHISGRGWREPAVSQRAKKFIIQMPHMNRSSIDWLAPADKVTCVRTWDEVIGLLKADYPGGAKVVVVPDATIQYFDVQATLLSQK